MSRNNSALLVALGALALLGSKNQFLSTGQKRKKGKIIHEGAQHCDVEIFGECLLWDYDYKVMIEGFGTPYKPLTKALFESDPNFQNSLWLFPGVPENYGMPIMDTPNWKAVPHGIPLMQKQTPYIRGGFSQNWDPGNMGNNYALALDQAGNSFADELLRIDTIVRQDPGTFRFVSPEYFTPNDLTWVQTGMFGVSADFRLGDHYLEPFEPYDPAQYEFELVYTKDFKHNVERDEQWDKAVEIIKVAVEMYIKFYITGTI